MSIGKTELSRRQFLFLSGLTLAEIALFLLTGCTPETEKQALDLMSQVDEFFTPTFLRDYGYEEADGTITPAGQSLLLYLIKQGIDVHQHLQANPEAENADKVRYIYTGMLNVIAQIERKLGKNRPQSSTQELKRASVGAAAELITSPLFESDGAISPRAQQNLASDPALLEKRKKNLQDSLVGHQTILTAYAQEQGLSTHELMEQLHQEFINSVSGARESIAGVNQLLLEFDLMGKINQSVRDEETSGKQPDLMVIARKVIKDFLVKYIKELRTRFPSSPYQVPSDLITKVVAEFGEAGSETKLYLSTVFNLLSTKEEAFDTALEALAESFAIAVLKQSVWLEPPRNFSQSSRVTIIRDDKSTTDIEDLTQLTEEDLAQISSITFPKRFPFGSMKQATFGKKESWGMAARTISLREPAPILTDQSRYEVKQILGSDVYLDLSKLEKGEDPFCIGIRLRVKLSETEQKIREFLSNFSDIDVFSEFEIVRTDTGEQFLAGNHYRSSMSAEETEKIGLASMANRLVKVNLNDQNNWGLYHKASLQPLDWWIGSLLNDPYSLLTPEGVTTTGSIPLYASELYHYLMATQKRSNEITTQGTAYPRLPIDWNQPQPEWTPGTAAESIDVVLSMGTGFEFKIQIPMLGMQRLKLAINSGSFTADKTAAGMPIIAPKAKIKPTVSWNGEYLVLFSGSISDLRSLPIPPNLAEALANAGVDFQKKMVNMPTVIELKVHRDQARYVLSDSFFNRWMDAYGPSLRLMVLVPLIYLALGASGNLLPVWAFEALTGIVKFLPPELVYMLLSEDKAQRQAYEDVYKLIEATRD